MAGANEFKTVITADDKSGAAWASFEKRSDRAKAASRKTEGSFGRMVAPVRKLSPEFDRTLSRMARMGKASSPMLSALTSNRGRLRKEMMAAEKEAERLGEQAASRAAAKHGLGRTFGRASVLRSAAARFAGIRAGAAPGALSAAAGAEEHAFDGAYIKHMAAAEQRLGVTAAEVGSQAGAAEGGLARLAMGVGGLATAAVGAVVGVGMLSAKFAKIGQEVQNASLTTGVDQQTLQRYRGAAERVGLDPHTADQALGGLGMTLHNLSYGVGDATQANLLRQSGVKIPGRGEDADLGQAVDAISKRAEGMNGFTRINYLRSLGMESLLPLIAKGGAGVASKLKSVDDTGLVMSDDDVKKQSDQAERFTDLQQRGRSLAKLGGSLSTDVASWVMDPKRALGDLAGATDGATRALHDMPAVVERIKAMALRPRERAGLTPEIEKALRDAAARFHLDPNDVLRVVKQESQFDPRARATTSTARGLFQFTEQTWLQTLKKHGGDHGYGKEAGEIVQDPRDSKRLTIRDAAERRRVLDLREDVRASSLMGGAFTADNVQAMQHIGRPANATDLYAAHFLGAGAARKLAEAVRDHPNERAAQAFPAAAGANRSIFYDHGRERSMAELYDKLARLVGGPDSGQLRQPGAASAPNAQPKGLGAATAAGAAPAAPQPAPAKPAQPGELHVYFHDPGDKAKVVAVSPVGSPPVKVHRTRGPSGG